MMGMCFGGLCGGFWGRYKGVKGDLDHEWMGGISIDTRRETNYIRLYGRISSQLLRQLDISGENLRVCSCYE